MAPWDVPTNRRILVMLPHTELIAAELPAAGSRPLLSAPPRGAQRIFGGGIAELPKAAGSRPRECTPPWCTEDFSRGRICGDSTHCSLLPRSHLREQSWLPRGGDSTHAKERFQAPDPGPWHAPVAWNRPGGRQRLSGRAPSKGRPVDHGVN